MSIELHCPQCSKIIRAPDNAGGKHGKCPHCQHRVYIPMSEDKIEILELAPISEEELQQEEQLRRESISYAANISHDKSSPSSESGSSTTSPGDSVRQPEVVGEVIDIGEVVERFIIAMRDSKLNDADQAVVELSKAGKRSKDYVQGLIVDEMPPQIDNVPPPLLKGFLKTLLGRIG